MRWTRVGFSIPESSSDLAGGGRALPLSILVAAFYPRICASKFKQRRPAIMTKRSLAILASSGHGGML
jgi:hypothetical protein